MHENSGGTLYTLAYGNPCSLNIDPIENRCSIFIPGKYFIARHGRMQFSLPELSELANIAGISEDFAQYRFTPEEIVQTALSYHTKMIAFTYTEPTIFYEYMYDISVLAHRNGIKTVIVSNGFINPEPLNDFCPLLDAANIDLKCFDDAVYKN